MTEQDVIDIETRTNAAKEQFEVCGDAMGLRNARQHFLQAAADVAVLIADAREKAKLDEIAEIDPETAALANLTTGEASTLGAQNEALAAEHEIDLATLPPVPAIEPAVNDQGTVEALPEPVLDEPEQTPPIESYEDLAQTVDIEGSDVTPQIETPDREHAAEPI